MSKTRAIHATDLSYCQPSWHQTPPDIEHGILDLLLPILRPIGESRTDVKFSKRKRRKGKAGSGPEAPLKDHVGVRESAAVTVGFNSITRHLEGLTHLGATEYEGENGGPRRIGAVLACPAAMPPPAVQSLPLLVAVASKTSVETIRLVQISPEAEAAIAKALSLPRVGTIALVANPPETQALLQYIRQSCTSVDVQWLGDASVARYLPLKLRTTSVPVSHKAPAKRGLNEGEDG